MKYNRSFQVTQVVKNLPANVGDKGSIPESRRCPVGGYGNTLQCFCHEQRSLVGYSLSVQFSSVAQSCLTLFDPMNHSMPGLPVHHKLPKFTQTHVHRVSDAIQPSHPLSSPSPPGTNPSQHQGLFQWVSSLHEVAKVLEFQPVSVLPVNTQDWSSLGWTGWISLQSKGLSRVFSNTIVQKHQFFGTQLSSQSNSQSLHDHWKDHNLD